MVVGMANHKRRRPKVVRAGCLLCKPHKLTAAVKGRRARERRRELEHERRAG